MGAFYYKVIGSAFIGEIDLGRRHCSAETDGNVALGGELEGEGYRVWGGEGVN